MSKNAVLDSALALLSGVDNADDMLHLNQQTRALRKLSARLNGIQGGIDDHVLGTPAQAAYQAIGTLWPDDLATVEIVTRLLHTLMRPKVEGSRGVVQLKTIVKHYPEIDWQETAKSGGEVVFVTDENGARLMVPFYYTYAYVRQYASKGDSSRRRAKLLSLYADRGMGKGGSGGYVAAALNAGHITEDEILTAWHAGLEAYQSFIDQCAGLVGTPAQDESADDQPE